MTNVEALQALYTALGGTASDVANCTTIVEVLNAIAAKYDGADDAVINPDAIANIAAVADNIGGGGDNNAQFSDDASFGSPAISSLLNIEIPEGVTSIGPRAFQGASRLKTVTIPSTMTYIANSSSNGGAFYECTSIETITVNKPEGSLNGAPWGATNAQVIWNG